MQLFMTCVFCAVQFHHYVLRPVSIIILFIFIFPLRACPLTQPIMIPFYDWGLKPLSRWFWGSIVK